MSEKYNIDNRENVMDLMTIIDDKNGIENGDNSPIEKLMNCDEPKPSSSIKCSVDIVKSDVSKAGSSALIDPNCVPEEPSTCTSTSSRRYNLRYRSHRSLAIYQQELKDIGLYVRQVKGDGACLFRALSLQAFGTENMHHIIRRTTMDYITLNRDKFASFITDETFENYVNRKRDRGTFGNHIEFQAAANVFRRCIEIYDHQRDSIVPIVITPAHSENLRRPFRLLFQGIHFDALFLRDEESMYPTPTNFYGEMIDHMDSCERSTSRFYNLRRKRAINYTNYFNDDDNDYDDDNEVDKF